MRRRTDRSSPRLIKGVDVYDPTTGQIRSASTDDIACWFLDTDYNGESFFVRHAYFTGADQPYEKLKRALRADINEEAWQSLYSTVSRPFDKPGSGKIAIKVINHYGDEMLKVFEIFQPTLRLSNKGRHMKAPWDMSTEDRRQAIQKLNKNIDDTDEALARDLRAKDPKAQAAFDVFAEDMNVVRVHEGKPRIRRDGTFEETVKP